MSDMTLQHLLDRVQIIETVTKLFIYTDQFDWSKILSECFTSEVLFDMKSVTGNEPTLMPALDIVSAWETGLKPLAAVHHQVGNFLVNLHGESADVFCYGLASHYLPNPSGSNTRLFAGSYDFHLTRIDDQWRIDRFRFNLKYTDGNMNLETSK